MNFPKLLPNWFAKMPTAVKASVVVLFVVWIVGLIITPSFTLFFTSIAAVIASLIRLANYFMFKE